MAFRGSTDDAHEGARAPRPPQGDELVVECAIGPRGEETARIGRAWRTRDGIMVALYAVPTGDRGLTIRRADGGPL